MTLKKSINFCVIFQTGKNEKIILPHLAGGLWDLIVCRALCYPQMRGKGLSLYHSWRKAEAWHGKPWILQDRDCSAQRAHLSLRQGGRTAWPYIPCPIHTDSNFPAEKTSSALHLGVQLSPSAPGFHQLWRLMSPCSRVMEPEAMRRNELTPLVRVHLASPQPPSFGNFADPHQ